MRSRLGVADFETTTKVDDCRVWAFTIYDIRNDSSVVGNNIEDFFKCLVYYDKVWFHNLKFDGAFIIDWLLKHQFNHLHMPLRSLPEKSFSILRSDDGVMYSINLCWYNGERVAIWDSLKKINSPVSRISADFGIEEIKGCIDYTAEREKGHELTPEEVDYVVNDAVIVGKALKELLDEGMDSMTVGADAFKEFKKQFNETTWNKLFPVIPDSVDAQLRQAYRGGFTWVNPLHQEEDIGAGLVYDNNSMHPSQLRYKPMPVGEPEYYKGAPKASKDKPLFIQHMVVTGKIKPDHIPTVSTKNCYSFKDAEYVTEMTELDIWMTSVDLSLMLDHYDIEYCEMIEGYRFAQAEGIFNHYIDKWADRKASSKGAKKQIAKMMLNNLYGKFATRIIRYSTEPFLDNERVRYRVNPEPGKAEPAYLPVAIFTTAYSRDTVIRAAQVLYDRILYIDTDSLHISGLEIPTNIDIDDKILGKWKLESKFVRARFLRCKRYIEEIETKEGTYLNVKCGGMPDKVKEQVTWDNFKRGKTYHGKLMPKTVPGGVVLLPTDYNMK